MKAASGKTEVGGERRPPWLATEEGWSLEMLGDLVVRGEGYPESNLGVCVPTSEGAIANYRKDVQRRALPQCLMCVARLCGVFTAVELQRSSRRRVGRLDYQRTDCRQRGASVSIDNNRSVTRGVNSKKCVGSPEGSMHRPLPLHRGTVIET